MRFRCNVLGVITIVGLSGSNDWRPKHMAVHATKADPSLAKNRTATLMARRKTAITIKRPDPEALRNRIIADMLSREDAKQPDISFLTKSAPAKMESIATCTQGFVTCDYGIDTATGDPCYTTCGGSCCTGFYACAGLTGSVCKDGSCAGDYSCAFTETNEVVNGCLDGESCGFTKADVIHNSCHEGGSCTFAGADGGSIKKLINSCRGFNACFDAGSYGRNAGDFIGSCIGEKACHGAAVGADIGDVIGSCQADSACFNIVKDANLTGGIINTCNAVNACKEFGVGEPIYGALTGCCNTEAECENLSTFPPQCLDVFISSHALDRCDINITEQDGMDLMCTFTSTRGVPVQAEIRLNSCIDNNGFNEESSSEQTTEEIATVNFDLAATIDANDKNAESITRELCVRSDMFGFDGTELVSISVVKVNVEVFLSFSSTAQFIVEDIVIEPFQAITAQTSAARQVVVNAALGDCSGGNVQESYGVGTILNVCVSVDNADIEITSVKDVTMTDPPQVIIDDSGNTNFVTTASGFGSSSVNIRTLMITNFFDNGNDSVSLTGTAELNFIGRRSLSNVRLLQEQGSSVEAFTVEIPLKTLQMPEFTPESYNGSIATGFGAAAIFIVGMIAAMLM